MKKIAIALSLVLGLTVAQPASAQYWGDSGGTTFGAVLGGMALGAWVGNRIASNTYYGQYGWGSNYPSYYVPAPVPVPAPQYYYYPQQYYYYGY